MSLHKPHAIREICKDTLHVRLTTVPWMDLTTSERAVIGDQYTRDQIIFYLEHGYSMYEAQNPEPPATLEVKNG